MMMLLGTSSCQSSKKNLRETKGSYLESAKLNFDAGVEAFNKKDYEKAIGYFQFVKSKYPFSKFAALSDLRIADAKFAQEKWLDAASMYEIFIRLHPRHEEVAFASFRMGMSYFYAIPSDFFLLPKAVTRDQSHTEEALATLELFIFEHPNSEYVAEAKEKREILFSSLAKHNQHIAEYYAKRGRFEAALARHQRVYELYPNTEEALQSLNQAAYIAYKNLSDIDKAVELYAILVSRTSDGAMHERAKKMLSKLLEKKRQLAR